MLDLLDSLNSLNSLKTPIDQFAHGLAQGSVKNRLKCPQPGGLVNVMFRSFCAPYFRSHYCGNYGLGDMIVKYFHCFQLMHHSA